MSGIPTGRLLVYIISGLVVLVVGTVAIISMRADASSDEAVSIEAGDVATASGLAETADAGEGSGGGSTDGSVSSTSTEPLTIFVQVAGAVRSPGVYEMQLDARVFQAIAKAGGFAENADQQSITLAAQLTDGCRVYVPRTGEVAEGGVVAPEGQTFTSEGNGIGGQVSINSATLEELDALPGVGPAIAQDIITFRETNGPFTSVDELTDVPGIGPAKLERLRSLVTL